MMYSAYFDESGSQDDGKHVIVSGFVAEVGQWIHFEREWRSVLDAHAVSVFHANEFGHEVGEFKSWDDTKRRTFLDLLVGIIRRRTNKSFSTAIPLNDFRQIDSQFLLKESVGYPYPLAARVCMDRVYEWAASHGILEPIEFFFEDGAKRRGQLLWIAEKDKKPTPIFKKKSEIIQFQAADLLAWEHNRLLRKDRSKWLNNLSPVLQKLEEMSNDWGICGKQELLALCDDVKSRSRHCTYSYKIIKRGGKRIPVIRVGLRARWGHPPMTAGGGELFDVANAILSSRNDHNSTLTWDVFEDVGGDSVQLQLRIETRRESLIIEEAQSRGLHADARDKAIEWIAQTLISPSFGYAPNIAIVSWDGQRVP
jgi:hypothetical protein